MSSPYTISDSEASDATFSGRPYEVFLSFRGFDTRNNFTDYLYTRLTDAGIKTYRDDEELRVGEEIGSELIAGINQSTIAIPIFSKGYAASKWCLKELAYIVECKRSRGLKVMPIFYDVSPSQVRSQTGDFAEAFVSHEKSYDDETIRCWKEAMKVVGALKGWDMGTSRNRQEGMLVKEVTKKVLRELKKAYLVVTDCLVGVDHHAEEILNKVCPEIGDVRIFGIYGMGGIGKTTLAKVIYNHLLSQFENSVFLADVRETSQSKGMEFLQNQLICNLLNIELSVTNTNEGIAAISTRLSNQKVLIVLDDVDKNFQLQGLVGKRNWFGPGTRIIITTRNKSVLDFIQVDWPFELSSMDPPQALQLFSKHAFRDDKPPKLHAELSERIVEITGGLPLALEVVGSLLYGKSMGYWRNILKKLQKVPQKEVASKLRISFETLDVRQKHIFLDIACFFIGVDYRIAIHYWDEYELFPEEATEVLQQMSFIKVQANNLLWMHDQLRDYGRDIVCQENIINPEMRSRIWNQEDATKVLTTKRETEKIQGICVEVNKKSCPYFTEEYFAKLSKVRLLWVEKSYRFSYLNRSLAAASSKILPKKQHIFLEDVRWLSWHWFPHSYIKTSKLSLLNLTVLDLSYSDFTIQWDGWSQIKMAKNLKILNLTGCENLVGTPEFSSHPLLEQLILRNCYGLIWIDKSIGMLEHLVHLNLEGCYLLHELPIELSCMESLTELIVDDTNIVEIPPWRCMVKSENFSVDICTSLRDRISMNNLTSLEKFSLRRTRVTLIHNSIGELVHLSELCLWGCEYLKKLPESIGGLVSLIELDISMSGIEELPNSIGCLRKLKLLRMSNTPIRELPTTIGMAGMLEELDATYCKHLIGLPKLPESLINLKLPSKIMVTIPDLSNLIKLKLLRVDTYEDMWTMVDWEPKQNGEWTPVEMPTPRWIVKLNKVEKLDFPFPSITTLHPELCVLSLLTELRVIGCVRLQSVPKLPSNLTTLEVSYCWSLETISDLSHLKKLSTLTIQWTPLIKLEGLHSLESLKVLTLDECMISEIDGMSENLSYLRISRCRKLERLSQMSNCKRLKEFNLEDCPNLVAIHGKLDSLEILTIEDCNSLMNILDVVNMKALQLFSVFYSSKSCRRNTKHEGPIPTNNFLTSESEGSFMSTMFNICDYSQNIMLWNEEVEGEGKGKRKWDET